MTPVTCRRSTNTWGDCQVAVMNTGFFQGRSAGLASRGCARIHLRGRNIVGEASPRTPPLSSSAATSVPSPGPAGHGGNGAIVAASVWRPPAEPTPPATAAETVSARMSPPPLPGQVPVDRRARPGSRQGSPGVGIGANVHSPATSTSGVRPRVSAVGPSGHVADAPIVRGHWLWANTTSNLLFHTVQSCSGWPPCPPDLPGGRDARVSVLALAGCGRGSGAIARLRLFLDPGYTLSAPGPRNYSRARPRPNARAGFCS